jgi:hypothetical protein
MHSGSSARAATISAQSKGSQPNFTDRAGGGSFGGFVVAAQEHGRSALLVVRVHHAWIRDAVESPDDASSGQTPCPALARRRQEPAGLRASAGPTARNLGLLSPAEVFSYGFRGALPSLAGHLQTSE